MNPVTFVNAKESIVYYTTIKQKCLIERKHVQTNGGELMKNYAKKRVALSLVCLMICTLILPTFFNITKVNAESSKTTVYYGFTKVESFVEGEEYMFVPEELGANLTESSCLLALPDGSAILKATGTTTDNGAGSNIVEWNNKTPEQIAEEIGYYEEEIEWYKEQQIQYPEETWYEEEIEVAERYIAALKNRVTYTLDTYVDVVEDGAGFDGCDQGALCNKGTGYFCNGGGVQGLKGLTVNYKVAEVDDTNLSAVLKESAINKAASGAVELTVEDVEVYVEIEGKKYEVSDFEITDASLDLNDGDDTISVKFGNSEAIVTVSVPDPEPEPQSEGAVSGRDGAVSVETLKINNADTEVQDGSAAAEAGKTVDEVIDTLAGTDTTAKVALVESAVEKGDLEVTVTNVDVNKVKGSVDDAAVLLAALTGQELIDGITGNDTVKLELVIGEKSASDVATSLAGSVKQVANNKLQKSSTLYYFDTDLYLTKNGISKENITEFGSNNLKLTFTIPTSILSVADLLTLIRTHDETDGTTSVDALEDIDTDATTYSVESNKLCTMAYAYTVKTTTVTPTTTTTTSATTSVSTAPKTGETTSVWMFVFCIAAVVFSYSMVRKVK